MLTPGQLIQNVRKSSRISQTSTERDLRSATSHQKCSHFSLILVILKGLTPNSWAPNMILTISSKWKAFREFCLGSWLTYIFLWSLWTGKNSWETSTVCQCCENGSCHLRFPPRSPRCWNTDNWTRSLGGVINIPWKLIILQLPFLFIREWNMKICQVLALLVHYIACLLAFKLLLCVYGIFSNNLIELGLPTIAGSLTYIIFHVEI